MGTDELVLHLNVAQPPSAMCTSGLGEACQKIHSRQPLGSWWVSNTLRIRLDTFPSLSFCIYLLFRMVLFFIQMSSYSFSSAKHLASGAEYHIKLLTKHWLHLTFYKVLQPGHIIHSPSHLPQSNHKVEVSTSAAKAKMSTNGVKEEFHLLKSK